MSAGKQPFGKAISARSSRSALSRATGGGQLIESLGDDGEIGAGLGGIEPHDDVAGFHLTPSPTRISPTTPPVG